ncbi:tryptophan-rich sensory protein [Candidatus Leptofilum sp.]|uniref:tryptophan-rich sensory protein n=1 Tax=Candidatus Leptofilum sp. TaxID=3241576 RepID=UPI003B5A5FDF
MNTQKPSLKTVQIVNIVSFVTVFIVNVLSNALPLNGRTPGEISDALPSFFTPAGYTFSIWSLIYLGLLGFTLYQALPAQRNKPFLTQIGWGFALSSVANIAWLFAWHYGFYALSILFMVSILVVLITIYYRLGIGQPNPNLPLAERVLVQFPFSIYLGWITVATIANIASVANYLGWDGFGIAEPTWAAIMMGVAVIVVGLVLFNRRNVSYAGVLIWALFGIRAANMDVPIVANTAVIAAILILLIALVGYWRTRRIEPAATARTRPA